MKLAIGDRIIAKRSNEKCGFRKGDELRIIRKSIFENDFIAENLTRPDCYGQPWAYISYPYWGFKRIKNGETVFAFSFKKWLITIKRL